MGLALRSEDFDTASALVAATALQEVLARRTHRKKFLGQELLVPGQLGSALQLPRIVNQLQSKQERRRIEGLEAFQTLWLTLSDPTRHQVLEAIGWYDPHNLDWEDKRSNRRPAPGHEDS